ncbi:MAG: L-lactate permease [Solirubrobacteraceae bacterium]|nr:MAG: lactate transporter [Solirubrobacterales bacterium]
MYRQVLDPVSHSLGLTSIFALAPLACLFVLLGVLRLKAQWAALAALGVALVVALAVYSMPVGQAADAGLEGAAFGLFPIMWIVVNAVWIYRMTEETGHFLGLRRAFETISSDQRIQVIAIAFCFGALLEALAGFGTPVAICGVMMVGLGIRPVKAAAIALVADTAPVAFGAIAIPITTLSQVSGLHVHPLSQMVGRQTPFLALVLPFVLVGMVDGRRGLRDTWPAALVAGAVFAAGQFACSNYISTPLTDIVASLLSAAALVAFLRVWSPGSIETTTAGAHPAVAGAAASDPAFEREIIERRGSGDEGPRRPVSTLAAFAPYLIIIVVLGLQSLHAIQIHLESATNSFKWPGLDVLNAKGKAPTSEIFKLNYLTAAGTGLFVSGLLSMLVLRLSPRRAVVAYGRTLAELKWAIFTVATVLAIAYVMNLSGQTITLGMWAAGAGGFFAFLSPLIGWFGTAVTGSDTSTNSLFGALQVAAAKQSGLSPTLLAAANSSGGVVAKMVSPQNLAIGAAAVGFGGREGEIFRQVIGWSVLFVLGVAVLVLLQSTSALSWMVP